MAAATDLVDLLRATLKLLEQADLQGVKAKHQLAQIIGVDFQPGSPVLLIPSFFTVEGIQFQATVTPQQRDAIVAASSGTIQDVIDALVIILNNNLFAGAAAAIGILEGALSNQPPPTFAAAAETPMATSNQPPPLGACVIGGSCKPNFDATLCQTLGGQPVQTCGGNPPQPQ
jgi:hypothetical protein